MPSFVLPHHQDNVNIVFAFHLILVANARRLSSYKNHGFLICLPVTRRKIWFNFVFLFKAERLSVYVSSLCCQAGREKRKDLSPC